MYTTKRLENKVQADTWKMTEVLIRKNVDSVNAHVFYAASGSILHSLILGSC